jgi:hypothetical protein
MPAMRSLRTTAFALVFFAIFALSAARSHAQAALLMEEPYGFFGSVNPTGHNAVYFARICAETPVKLRRCEPGEMGAVIARYEGINGDDWLAIPLMPYLYSVEKTTDVPVYANRPAVNRLRERYHEAQLLSLGDHLPPGSFMRGGWTELIGVSYERRIYAFRFDTTEQQDDELIDRLNDSKNRAKFNLLFNNCSDFARRILDFYFPGTFKRSIFPDAGVTTPKQLAYKLERYSCKHPEMHLTIYALPQIPGYRRHSHSNRNVAESLAVTGYDVPIALANPYLAGGLFVDYLVRGRHRLIPKNLPALTADKLWLLTGSGQSIENRVNISALVPGTVRRGIAQAGETAAAGSSLPEIRVANE